MRESLQGSVKSVLEIRQAKRKVKTTVRQFTLHVCLSQLACPRVHISILFFFFIHLNEIFFYRVRSNINQIWPNQMNPDKKYSQMS